MKKLMLLLFLVLLLESLSSEVSIGTFGQNENVELYQTCNNCTYCNFTRVMNNENSTILTNVEANNDGDYYYYNLNGDNTTGIGIYTYCYNCGNTVDKETGCLEFEVTGTGFELTPSRTNLYLGLLLMLIVLFVINLFVIPKLPATNNYEEDRLISVSQLKYLRLVLFGVAWFLLMGIIYVGANLGLAYLGTTLLGSLLFKLFSIMMIITYPAILLFFIYIFYNIVEDRKLKRMIAMGFE